MSSSKLFSALALASLGGAMLATMPAQAVPIQYVFSGTVSGTLGTQTFTNATITFTANGDTANISNSLFGHLGPSNEVGGLKFTLSGFGTGTLPHDFEVNDYPQFSDIGLSLVHGPDYFNENAPEYATYGLTTDLGPIASNGNAFGSPIGTFTSSLGNLTLDKFGPATFTATTSPIPEASTTVSLGALLFCMGGLVIVTKVIAAKRKGASIAG